ncbi:MAG: alpha/beta fold hydrolase [Solirubrobacterales bacterium]|nr:alpha/beta fold hydrolase [Solirubrobacterales bacterium]
MSEPERAAGLAYERAGDGPPLVLIHGLGATREIWRPQIGLLAGERDVIAVDMPGFGASPVLEEPATPWALGGAIAGLCDELGIDRPHLAGNSLGGWVALEMAKSGRAASACLISPAGLWRRPLGARRIDARAWARRLRPLVLGLTRLKPAREAMLRTSLGLPERAPAAVGRSLIEAWIDSPGYEAANAEMRRYVCEDLDRVTVPTTIVWGELDRLVAPPRPERRPPGSRYLQFERLGHTPNWDDPELVARLLLEASSAAAPAAATISGPEGK